MLKLQSTELSNLILQVLVKRNWTQAQLSQELNKADPDKSVGSHTVSRWKKDGKIYRAHYDALLRLDKDEEVTPTQAIQKPMTIPFSVTIPRESLQIVLDKNGDINIRGLLVAAIEQKEK